MHIPQVQHKTKYPFRRLGIGDSFFVPKPCNISAKIAKAREALGHFYSRRSVTENGIEGFRVWRVEGPTQLDWIGLPVTHVPRLGESPYDRIEIGDSLFVQKSRVAAKDLVKRQRHRGRYFGITTVDGGVLLTRYATHEEVQARSNAK